MKTITISNVTLIVVGLITMSIGFYRVAPIKVDRAFMWQNGPLVLMLLAGSLLLSKNFSTSLVRDWVGGTAILGGRFLPLMILLSLVMALGSIMTRMYGSEIEGFLNRHHILTPLVASWFTPTPSSVIPIIESVWSNKISQPYLLYFLQAASLMSFPLFMLRQLGMRNPEIFIKMYLIGCIICGITFPLTPLIGKVVQWIYSVGERFGLV